MDNCQCNPAIDNILGPEGKKLYDIEFICRVAQPTKWGKVRPFFIRQCGEVETHNYGCERPDSEIDAERFASIQGFQNSLADSKSEKTCLDTPKFADNLSKVLTKDIKFNVPYGIGSYVGIQGVSEYLGMVFNGLTHGFWFNDIAIDPTKKARFEIDDDGKTWTLGSTTKGEFYRGGKPYTDLYIEQKVKFQGCDTQISDYTILPGEGMKFVIERIVQAADLSKRWGAEDICRYHTKFCAADPNTKQYESEQACLSYMKSLPLYSQACGKNRPLSGNSLSCKLKHHFMIPAHPSLHCPHIGPKGRLDPDNHAKCDDVAECTADEGQDNWPNIENIGANTPPDIKLFFEKDNVDYKKEPFGCAIPSVESGELPHHR